MRSRTNPEGSGSVVPTPWKMPSNRVGLGRPLVRYHAGPQPETKRPPAGSDSRAALTDSSVWAARAGARAGGDRFLDRR